ncbi:bifunctional hydroxymethylpyrimidine kinase/phosphomethylpyrimidine kinase [Pseudorhodoferax sp.]|uniref:bifunctional hydroxymethylpyrimidine kinase/phosphomethylpyrimidine kinase n=1 Tax=Pseudorhodoferax sp. TaxID=1993553 RepID=UPI002DD65B9E|nr:bifunctional hydroxymethylpyrimidine kinase/phosphomethylpyrimidine kinase [Pseudorhodoferax sp.]
MKRVWSIAGTDSSGGAGLAADQRALDAWPGTHYCGVVAAVTAQNSQAVTRVEAVSPALLGAQLAALEADMPPAALKTGLLADAAQMRSVAAWTDRLREAAPGLPLVVDPVLGASSGANFADDAAVAGYRTHLLPRATLITPNRREAARLLGRATLHRDEVPRAAQDLRALGAQAVCITGGDPADTPDDATPAEAGLALDWLDSPHARGWLALPRIGTGNTHATGCTFASTAAAALAHGFVAADAVVLAKMAATHALRHGHAAGRGPGQVLARPGFHAEPALLPQMGFGAEPVFVPAASARPAPLGLYAIVDSAERVRTVLAAGVRSVQLRIKRPDVGADGRWRDALHQQVADAAAACRAAGARLFVNDHWQLAARCGAHGVHLGQEDLLALDGRERADLRSSGLALGISSHSLWELARARSLAPAYIACGPVWPTLTKAMPWRPQGLDNLAWWCAMAGAPVVAIGGVLAPAQLADAARQGADGVCVVRMLDADPAATVPGMLAALAEPGPTAPASSSGIPWPHPTLT